MFSQEMGLTRVFFIHSLWMKMWVEVSVEGWEGVWIDAQNTRVRKSPLPRAWLIETNPLTRAESRA
jgi:hypothetical protein